MNDFRTRIGSLKHKHTIKELRGLLADRLNQDPSEISSVNPVTNAVFERVLPEHDPIEYARTWEGYSAEWSPVRKRATALRMFLTNQIGRPKYERIPRLRAHDWAELIVAVDAAGDGVERSEEYHVPTTLPIEADQYLTDPPERTELPPSQFDKAVKFGDKKELQLSSQLGEDRDAPYSVYVLECTPPLGSKESRIMQALRRDVHAKMQAGYEFENLEPKEQAAAAANDNCRIFYVGHTTDVTTRVQEHIAGASKSGTRFTNDIPPVSLVEITGCTSKREAERLERERAEQLNSREDSFAYFN